MRRRSGLALHSLSTGWWPELVLAFAACLIFLGFLGKLELWGKREQRAAAEALDTVENQRWLVAQIQGRPRLEKPPLPRWTAAALMTLTNRRDEGIVRLPSALSGLATVALVYLLGGRIGGRVLARASAMTLCTMGLFIVELRQAGNDGMLALFTTLAVLAAWCRLHGGEQGSFPSSGIEVASLPGSRIWAIVFYGALGLGFLVKGPIIVLIVGMAVVPYLLHNRSPGAWRGLFDWAGLLLFLGLAFCWPAAVLVTDPNAAGVWITEIGQKTGLLPIAHRDRALLGVAFPLLALPWSVMAMAGVVLPLMRKPRMKLPWTESAVWLPWWWSFGNLAMFSTWAVAKPNYYVPCLPGLALLVGMAWIRLCRVARDVTEGRSARLARVILFLQWLLLAVTGVLVPLMGQSYLPVSSMVWPIIIVATTLNCIALGCWIWHRGGEALAMAPIAVAGAVGVLIGYGIIAPADNAARGHRQLARRLEALLPPEVRTVHFFHEIDEGLWFYLHDHRLAPVPGTQPRYSDSHDKLASLISTRREATALPEPFNTPDGGPRERLLEWLLRETPDDPYLLIRAPLYEHMASDLEGLVAPLYFEDGLKRTRLILLHAGVERPRFAGAGM